MQFESLAVELQDWLKESVGRGCTAQAMEQSMRAAGHQPKFARRAVELAIARFLGDEPPAPARAGSDPADPALPVAVDPAAVAAGAEAAAAGAATPAAADPAGADPSASEILAAGTNAIDAGDRRVHLLFALNAPRVVLFANLLSDEECEEMIRLSRGKLSRSSVVNAETGSYDVHPDRTSEGTHFQRGENELIRRIERRIAELIGYPVDHGEPIQILYYRPGAEYKPHFDFFDPALPGNDEVLAMGGQRVATLVMYLNDVEAGGSTVFPEVGLDVLPRRGNAVYFAYTTEDGQLDRRTLHGGSPVAAGEKWIATKWLRQGPYAGPRA